MLVRIVLATFNRADMLRQTLDSFCGLDTTGIQAEFVAIDNNSHDQTRGVIDSFAEKLPLLHLFQPRPGKSAALNLALENIGQADVLVFTDDDVVPERDWLQQICVACREYPEFSVFGGGVKLLWPEQEPPPVWIRESTYLQAMLFGYHFSEQGVREYSEGEFGTGANFWIRGSILAESPRFHEALGASDDTPMGEEGHFQLALIRKGHRAVHYPRATVWHRASAGLYSVPAARARFYRLGRGDAHVGGLPDASLRSRAPRMWRFRRRAAVATGMLRWLQSYLSHPLTGNVEGHLNACRWLARDWESLRCTHNTPQ